MKTAILTDSAANLTKEFLDDNSCVYIIPLMINVDGVSYRDQVEISAEEVYEQLDDKHITTSLPLHEDLLEVIAKIKQDGYDQLLIITISSALSGTYNSFRLILEDETQLPYTIYDSKTLAGGQGLLVEQAAELVKTGKTIPEIVTELDKQRFESSIAMYTVNTLKYLR